jgi:hypothetical protein
MSKLQEIGKRPPKPSGENLSPEQATRRAVAAVFGALDGIVQVMIDRANAGSHLHARLLLDFAGISAASSLLPPESAAERPSLARLLMATRDQMAEESASAEAERPVE